MTDQEAEQQFWVDIPTLSSIYNGLLSDNITDLPVSCPTGNCTWPIIPTLGVCGACVDMQQQLYIGCDGETVGQDCNRTFTIPGGLTFERTQTMEEWNDTTPVFKAGPGSDYIFNQTDIVGEGYHYDKISFDFMGQSYSEFMWENRGEYSPGNDTYFYKGNILAVECGLWLCIQARSVNVTRGVLNDTVVAFANGINDTQHPDFLTQTRFGKVPDTFNVQNASYYGYSGLGGLGLQTTLTGLLTGAMTINGNFDISYKAGSVDDTLTGGLPGGIGSAADCLHAAWVYADDLNAWWARLAKSMTNNIRLNAVLQDEEGDRYAGTAWTNVVFIRVIWLWLIFPAALVLLSCLFLLATIVASARSGIQAWKTWLLPVLYTRLEEGLQEEWRQEYAAEGSLLEEVETRWVGLDDCGEDGWVFRHVVKDNSKNENVN